MTEKVMALQNVPNMNNRRKVFLDYAERVLGLKADSMEFLSRIVNECIADEFFSAPASSSGKYHPASSLGDGGLVRHTIVMTNIALDLLPMYELDKADRDVIILACLLHDAWKSADPQTGKWGLHSNVKTHGRIGAEFIIKAASVMKDMGELPIDESRVMNVVKDMHEHMSKWHETPVPYLTLGSPEAMVVAMADYIASRKRVSYEV